MSRCSLHVQKEGPSIGRLTGQINIHAGAVFKAERALARQVAEFLRSLPPRAALRVRRAAVYLADNRGEVETMLFEGALDSFSAAVEADAGAGLYKLSAQVNWTNACASYSRSSLVRLEALSCARLRCIFLHPP